MSNKGCGAGGKNGYQSLLGWCCFISDKTQMCLLRPAIRGTKCYPPIRSKGNRAGLWEELVAADSCNQDDCVRSHSPCTPQLKLLPGHLNQPQMQHSDSGVDMPLPEEPMLPVGGPRVRV